MVLVASPSPMQINKTTKGVEIPTIDLSCINMNRENLSKLLVKACEEYGFFKIINHGVSKEIISKLDNEGFAFFAKPRIEKEAALCPTRFGGYAFKNIGRHGDEGELEYLLFQANPTSVFEQSRTISSNPLKFSCAVNNYVEAVQKLACETLDLLAEGLEISDKTLFSKLISDVQSDGIFRINYFPPFSQTKNKEEEEKDLCDKLGFGAHTDIQLLTFLRSNDVDGLEISLHDGLWIPVSSDPTAFYVMVGDILKVLTNGRFVSIKHRVIANKEEKARMSMAYFPAPSLDAKISPIPELVMANHKNIYKPFTYGEFKTHAFSLRLGVSRLDPFIN